MAREQRRLAAIVAADVVGYSRLMGRDESGTLVRLRAHRTERLEPILARRGGRVVKLTGDGALVEFPSAVEAVSAAIEFQQAMADANAGVPDETAIVFRVGLHLGDLIVEGDDLYGDGVNVAARLEAQAPPGGIVLSRTVHEAVDGRLAATFSDLGDLALKNIERPVRAFRVEWNAVDWPAATRTAVGASSQGEPLALPDKPSIAVLPFTNMSGDPDQEFFVDGITEDIITELSRFHDLFVIARNSTFSYKGKSPDIRQVGRELGVRYVLEGSVRKAGNRVRVTAQLIEASTGSHLWAERYDRVLEDVFALQEDLTRGIAGAVAPTTMRTDLARAARMASTDLQAYGLAQKSVLLMVRDGYRSAQLHHDEAAALAREALARDQDCVLAMVALAQCHWARAFFSIGPYDESLRLGLDMCDRALTLDANDHTIHQMKGVLLHGRRDFDQALISLRRAHAINPNDASTLFALGVVEGCVGETETGIAHLLESLRRDPASPQRRNIYISIGMAHFVAQDYAAGLDWALRADSEGRDYPPALNLLLLQYVGLGRILEARGVLSTLERISPAYVRTRTDGTGFAPYRDEAQRRSRRFWRIAAGLEEPTP